MGLSLMVIAILLSFQGTAREAVASKITIAFFVLVTELLTEIVERRADSGLAVHDFLRQ